MCSCVASGVNGKFSVGAHSVIQLTGASTSSNISTPDQTLLTVIARLAGKLQVYHQQRAPFVSHYPPEAIAKARNYGFTTWWIEKALAL